MRFNCKFIYINIQCTLIHFDNKIKLYFKKDTKGQKMYQCALDVDVNKFTIKSHKIIGNINGINLKFNNNVCIDCKYSISHNGSMIAVYDEYNEHIAILDSSNNKIIYEEKYSYFVNFISDINGDYNMDPFELFWITNDILLLFIGRYRSYFDNYAKDTKLKQEQCAKLLSFCDIRNDEQRIKILLEYVKNIKYLVSIILDFIRFEFCDILLTKKLICASRYAKMRNVTMDNGNGVFAFVGRRCYSYWLVR
eukprot:137261_1